MKTKLFYLIRQLYRKTFDKHYIVAGNPRNKERVMTNNLISEMLSSNKPSFIGRIGSTELDTILNYLAVNSKNRLGEISKYIFSFGGMPWWDKKIFDRIHNNSGFFPKNDLQLIKKFCRLYLDDIPEMDLCGQWLAGEKYLPFKNDIIKVDLETLYPFFVKRSWFKTLEGKNVLVVHPFADSITKQYQQRELLFEDPSFLPAFNLYTIKAVQSIAGNTVAFSNWFEALNFMKEEIKKIDFDICILGCGAYGLPLGAFVKRLGKKAIHLGGGTQLLFGIKGKRWEKDYVDHSYRNLFNDHWIYPSNEEKIKGIEKVEGGCYW